MFERLAFPVIPTAPILKRVLTVTLALGTACLALSAEAMTFKFSSIGYHPLGSKIAVLEDVPEGQDLKIILYDTTRRNPRLPVFLGTTVFKVEKVREFRNREQQGPPIKNLMIDFSDFKEPGTYEFRIEGTDIKSQPVHISDYLYWDTLKPVVKSFYFQRCGQDVEDHTLKLFHPACHLKDAAFINPSAADEQDVVGGWHNGGDYAKYTTSTALAAAKLMAMAEWNPKPFKYFRLDYPIYEPGFGTTDDLHHEMLSGLDWLMAMQRRDGAVYRKVAGKQWPGKVTPDTDEQPRYIYGVSTLDTADVAATFAMASRSFKKVDLGYSVKTMMAAEKAWGFLEAHPNLETAQNPDDASGSGEFIDPKSQTDAPQRLWAAAELYVTTGKDKYHQYFLSHLKDVPLQRFSWQNPAILGITDYLFYAPAKNPAMAAALKGYVLNLADGIVHDIDGGNWPVGLRQFSKASNQEVTERAALLMAAYRLSGKESYREAANRSLAYLFGVNPMGMTYITGLDNDHQSGQTVTHPAHRWMEVTNKLIPGYMVDGPNEAPTDGQTPKGLGALSYTDSAAATSVNESTILDNASLAYVLSVLNDAYNVGKESGDQPPAKDTNGKLPAVKLPSQ